MNLYDSVVRAFPRHSYKLNPAGNGYVDVANNSGTITGTLTFSAPIVSANAKSLVISNAVNTVTSGVFVAGTENRPFTLEARFLPLTFTGNISILSHSGVFDGLWFDGNYIRFKVSFVNGTVAEVTWPVPDNPKVYQVIGSYSNSEVVLYIDGKLVGSYQITPEDVASGFANAASSNLVTGQASVSTMKALIDGISTYRRTLSSSEIYRNLTYGLDPSNDIGRHSAFSLTVRDSSERDISLRRHWGSREDWLSGELTRVGLSDEGIVPEKDPTTEVSVGNAIWAGILEIGSLEINPLYGIKAEWDGDGSYIVAISTDGVNYTNLVNGALIPGSVGMDPTGKVMDVRIAFVGGVLDDPAVVRRLEFTAYRTPYILGLDDSRTLSVSGEVSTGDDQFLVMSRSEGEGFNFNGGTLVLSTDSSPQPKTVKTVEMSVRPRGVVSGTSSTLFSTTGASVTINDTAKTISWTGMAAVYANGAAISSGAAIRYNEPTDFVFVLTTASSAAFTFGSNFLGNISHIGTSDATITAAQALTLFTSSFAHIVGAWTETGTVTISEPATPLEWYEYNWGGQVSY